MDLLGRLYTLEGVMGGGDTMALGPAYHHGGGSNADLFGASSTTEAQLLATSVENYWIWSAVCVAIVCCETLDVSVSSSPRNQNKYAWLPVLVLDCGVFVFPRPTSICTCSGL